MPKGAADSYAGGLDEVSSGMDARRIVPTSPQLKRARQLLDARAKLPGMPKPKAMPTLTDQECALLALEYDQAYEWVRQAFPWRAER